MEQTFDNQMGWPHAGKRHCPRYCCSDFHKHHDEKLTYQAALTNEILPLFATDRFPSDTDESVINMPQRLASRIILAGKGPSYIVTMAKGHLYFEEGYNRVYPVSLADVDARRKAKSEDRVAVSRYPMPHQLRNDQQTLFQAKKILTNLANMVHFTVDLQGGDHGECDPLNESIDPEIARCFPHGTRSRIRLNKTMYNKLAYMTRQKTNKNAQHQYSDREILYEQYLFAITLVHECSHALSNAVNGAHDGEPFYGSNIIAESGYDLENAIFGGTLSKDATVATQSYDDKMGLCPEAFRRNTAHSSLLAKEFLVLHEWPSGIKQSHYNECLAREHLDPIEKVRRVSFSYLLSLFSDSYWEDEVPGQPPGPLRVPTVGEWWRWRNPKTRKVLPYDLNPERVGEYPQDEIAGIVARELYEEKRVLHDE